GCAAPLPTATSSARSTYRRLAPICASAAASKIASTSAARPRSMRSTPERRARRSRNPAGYGSAARDRARRFDHVGDARKLRSLDHERAGKSQCLALADRAPRRIGDAFQVLDVGEAENAADHLEPAERE